MIDKKRSAQDESSKISKQSKRSSMTVQHPYDLSQRFQNLQNPLKFIENFKIQSLQKEYKNQQNLLKKQQESVSDFSKAIYKKVISRDNEYNFQLQIQGPEHDDAVQYFNNRHEGKGTQRKKDERKQREVLQRKFKHGQVISLEQKRQRQREQSQVALTFKHVKAIDTPEFEQCKDVQFYSIIKGQTQDKEYSHSVGNELENAAIQGQLQNFKHNLINQSQYQNDNTNNIMFDCDRELKFWRLQNIFRDQHKTEDDVLSNCAFFDFNNVSVSQMLDFSARNIEIDDVIKFYRLKERLHAKMEMDRNNESLQEKYNQAKRRFQQMKQNRLKSKNQRLPAKFVNSVAQTNDKMKEKDFDNYFIQDAKNIFEKIKKLNDIRDKIVEEQQGQTFNVMATNVGLQIGKELFKLLMLVLKGEKFLDYSSFMMVQNQQQVEKKLLELIYLEFKNFAEFEVNGIKKVDIIKRYLQQREKNERFFETYVYKHSNEQASKQKNRNKLTKSAKKK